MSDVIHVATLAVIRAGLVLCVRKRGTQRFMLPGGKPEAGETAIACLTREIFEELQCTVQTASLRAIGQFEGVAANEAGRRVRADVFVGEITGPLQLAAEIEEYRWLPLAGPFDVPLAPLLAEGPLLDVLRAAA
ncbi:NUDIX hydrolase [Silvimonas iriomotensis]|uniref:MutT/NUDIX family protein n=1 Tax=Silvimonas iriomotensis TaxID=449662 RepID=A0ABQ2P7U0_9NEIS|nr:NUDIX domain-containing protein [Silvimonas iriomotensis]GGP20101.1 MutT/NUDIX family protein [Silvimonas iriomotensis]